ncbi:MAG: VCBS repeat-containing protein [Burkholderiales bacterium]|nr:VCBS repeat-containing protein [Burkholderiales bacterium]
MDGRNRLSIGLQDAGLSPLSKTLVGTGDFDGDGKGDILWRDEAGQASLWRMNGTTIVTTNEGIVGPQFSGDTNWVVVGTGDADGDNRADVYWRNESDGRLGLWLSSASGELAAPGDWTGGDLINWQVADVNDYDGDGLHDLLLRKEDGTNAIWKLDALTAESSTILGGPAKGAQWAVAGQPLASDVTTGDALPNRLIGDLGADTMRGFAGEDRLDGRGGTDTLLGGEGDDVLVVGDGSFTLVDGGSGTDTFQFGGTNLALDFAAIANNRTAGIEAIDMTGSGNNTVRLNAADVLDFSNTSNSMTIIGDAGDAAQLAGGGWSAGAVSGGFRTYTSGQATLLVDTDIVVTVI